jgi:hypothetical protein
MQNSYGVNSFFCTDFRGVHLQELGHCGAKISWDGYRGLGLSDFASPQNH